MDYCIEMKSQTAPQARDEEQHDDDDDDGGAVEEEKPSVKLYNNECIVLFRVSNIAVLIIQRSTLINCSFKSTSYVVADSSSGSGQIY